MTTGTISIGGTGLQTGTVSIAPGTGAQTINIGTGGTGVKTIHIGDAAVANVITIGSTTGAAALTLNSGSVGIKALGVASVAVANKNYVTINTSTGALGSDAGPSAGITTINGNSGSVTGATVTISGGEGSATFTNSGTSSSLTFTNSNQSIYIGTSAGGGGNGAGNVGIGYQSLKVLSSSADNTCIGYQTGLLLTSSSSGSGLNTFVGAYSGSSISPVAKGNVALGYQAMVGSTSTGTSYNVALGYKAHFSIGSSSVQNVVIGYQAGSAYTGSESYNIIIGRSIAGVAGESQVTRIGNINGVSVTGSQVLVSSSDQLGVSTVGSLVPYTGTSHAATPYVVAATDYYISVDVTAGVVQVNLPNAPASNRIFVIKDKVGLAATSNITVTTVGGAVNIDGATTYVMNTAYESIQLIFNGTSYEIY
jgi:hypothetical protein